MLFAEQNKKNFPSAIMRQKVKTGFNITMHGNLAVLKSLFNYLDCIDSPTTDISTIYQLCQTTIASFYNSAVMFPRSFWETLTQKTSTKSFFGEIKDSQLVL